MPKKEKSAESQHYKAGRRSDPLKEFAASLEWFLQDQERRERRTRAVLAVAGPAVGLLGVLFSKQIATRISDTDLAAGLTQEQLNRLVPWLSSVFIMASILPWMTSANPPQELPLPKPLEYPPGVGLHKRKSKFVEMSREIARKLAFRTGLAVLSVFGVVKVLQSEGLLPKRIQHLWSKPIPNASSGYPEAYLSEQQEAPLPKPTLAEAGTKTASLATNHFSAPKK